MAEYDGPERRSGEDSRRQLRATRTREFSYERRRTDRRAGYGQLGDIGEGTELAGHVELQNDTASGERMHRGIVESKLKTVRPERRMTGAGRREGDLARALKTGEPAYYQVGKGAMAPTERRTGSESAVGRRIHSMDRRWRSELLGRSRGMVSVSSENPSFRSVERFNMNTPSGTTNYSGGLVEAKDVTHAAERRLGGAGRRAGDLAESIEKGVGVTYQAGKGAFKKGAKALGILGAAVTIGSLASQAHAAGRAAAQTVKAQPTYKEVKDILPAKPKVRKF